VVAVTPASTIPVVVFYLAFQDQFVRGLSGGAMKG
jgi:ABC-type glycerol-3-phosphate transport system permease component